MGHEIIWRFVGDPATQEAMDRIEQQLGVKLPRDYIECALKYHGAKPIDDIIDIGGGHRTDFNKLLSLNCDDIYYILSAFHGIRDRLVDHVYPFAVDSFGNFICFDYRKNKENPTIAFWDHEEAFLNKEKGITYICDTFTELLSKLRPDVD